MKTLLCRRAILLALMIPILRAAHAAEADSQAVTVSEGVYVRSGPGVSYRDMGTLDKDVLIHVLEVSGDGQWLRIVAPEDGDVWISAQFVKVVETVGAVTGDRVNVRVRPDLNSEQVNQLAKGTLVQVRGREGDWLQIAPPEGTQAWISAEHARRMTDAEVAAWREALARKKAEEETRQAEVERRLAEARAEAERRQAMEARKAPEARLLAEVDTLFAAELRKPLAERELAEVDRLYQEAAAQMEIAELREQVQARRLLIAVWQNIQSSLAERAAPMPLPDADLGAVMAELGFPDGGAELKASFALAEQKAEEAEAERKAAEKAGQEMLTLDGWIQPLPPGQEASGATHRISSGGRVLALIRSDAVRLDALAGVHIRVTGKVITKVPSAEGQSAVPLIQVEKATVILE